LWLLVVVVAWAVAGGGGGPALVEATGTAARLIGYVCVLIDQAPQINDVP
jgi:hypothetical protein